MFAVIFEVQPKRDRWDDYFALARLLKPEIEQVDGFIDNERFESQRRKGRVLSLSTWRNEKAVVRWRTLAVHHGAQEKGRREIIEDYHLRVGEITADTRVPAGQALQEQRLDETEVGEAKAMTVSELEALGGKPAVADLAAALGLPRPGSSGLLDHEVFDSVYNPGRLVLLAGWRDMGFASAWAPATPLGGTLRHRRVRVVRDYGMTDRREAPQYYPPVR
jgi:heme-degrading monooxygenase HmoA